MQYQIIRVSIKKNSIEKWVRYQTFWINLHSKNEIDQLYSELQLTEVYKINEGILYKDGVPYISVGDNVSLNLKESLSYNGVIDKISSFIEINISGTFIKISVSALNIGIAMISPN